MKKFLLAAFVLFGFAGTANAQVFLNNSVMHVFYEGDNEGLNLLSHEIGYLSQPDDDGISFGISAELDYGAYAGESTYQFFINPMISYQAEFGNILPYVTVAYSYVTFLELDDSGTGPSVTAGFLMPLSEDGAFFLHGRWFKYNNDIELGSKLVQFGYSWIF